MWASTCTIHGLFREVDGFHIPPRLTRTLQLNEIINSRQTLSEWWLRRVELRDRLFMSSNPLKFSLSFVLLCLFVHSLFILDWSFYCVISFVLCSACPFSSSRFFFFFFSDFFFHLSSTRRSSFSFILSFCFSFCSLVFFDSFFHSFLNPIYSVLFFHSFLLFHYLPFI